MKAILVTKFGGPEELKYTELPDPEPRSNEIVVQTEAVGINFADIMMRSGTYGGGPQPPFIPGFEVCGTVVDVGKSAHTYKPGDRVLGFAWRGGYAQRVAVVERNCLPLNGSLMPEEAVAIPVNYQTAYHCLVTLGQLKPGQAVLIHSAAGGVGTAAVQLAKTFGAKVIGTVGSDDKKKLVQELGADLVINYRISDFKTEVEDYTHNFGVDLALESVGGETFRKTLDSLHYLGKMIVYGYSSGEEGVAKTTDFIYHSRAIMGFHLASVMRHNDLIEEGMKVIRSLIADSKIRPVVGCTFPLADAAQAHSAVESRQTIGKVVLVNK